MGSVIVILLLLDAELRSHLGLWSFTNPARRLLHENHIIERSDNTDVLPLELKVERVRPVQGALELCGLAGWDGCL